MAVNSNSFFRLFPSFMERVSLTRALSLYKNAAVKVQTIPVPLTGVLITHVIRVPFH